jgi:acetyltransferase-like isoleucine patch superfamily enzyme
MRIGEGCRIYCKDFPTEPYLVTIGNRVGIAGGVRMLTHNGAAHMLRERQPKIQTFGRIEIGDNCFVGENAILLPGTTIGPSSIIGAGAVVSGTIPENSLAIGNPAKVIGRASLYLERLVLNPDTLHTFGLPEGERRQVILAHFSDRDPRAGRNDNGNDHG